MSPGQTAEIRAGPSQAKAGQMKKTAAEAPPAMPTIKVEVSPSFMSILSRMARAEGLTVEAYTRQALTRDVRAWSESDARDVAVLLALSGDEEASFIRVYEQGSDDVSMGGSETRNKHNTRNTAGEGDDVSMGGSETRNTRNIGDGPGDV
jgi:hypothetical protein